MTLSNFPARRIGGLALAIGGVTVIGIVSIMLFFTVGGVFGPLNDLCNAVEALLSAVLAWRIYPWWRSHAPRLSHFTLIAALVGVLTAVIGSVLIILDFTGWYLAGLYTSFGYALLGVWLFGLNLVAPLTGGSELAIVVSTLAIAALFAPLRWRIQNIIDRRFYRRKYDAAKVLAAFGVTVRDETNLDALTNEILRVVDETMQPEFVGLWLRDMTAGSPPKSTVPDSLQTP